MGRYKPSERVVLRRFLFAVASELCPDIAISAKEAEEFAEGLGPRHQGYWEGYADCATAVSEAGTRLADLDVTEVIKSVIAEYEAERAARQAISNDSGATKDGLRGGSPEIGEQELWDHLDTAVKPDTGTADD